MQPWKQIGRYGTVGLELVLSMAIGYAIGHWADGKLGTKFLALLGLVVGVYAGFRNLLRAAQFMQREAEREEADDVRRAETLLADAETRAVEASLAREQSGGAHPGTEAAHEPAPLAREEREEREDREEANASASQRAPEAGMLDAPGINAKGSKRGDAPS